MIKNKITKIYEMLEKREEENLSKGIFFDSDTYMYEEDFEYIVDDLDYLLKQYTRKSKGEIVGWLMLSHRSSRYGSICNNGATGYAELSGTDLSRAILTFSSADKITLKDNDGILEVTYYDHDGTDRCEVKSITRSREAVIESNGTFEQIISHLETIPSVKTNKNIQDKVTK